MRQFSKRETISCMKKKDQPGDGKKAGQKALNNSVSQNLRIMAHKKNGEYIAHWSKWTIQLLVGSDQSRDPSSSEMIIEL